MAATAVIGAIPFMLPESASVLASALGLVRSGEDTLTGLDMGRRGVHRPITFRTRRIIILLPITQTPRPNITIPAASTGVLRLTRRLQIRITIRPSHRASQHQNCRIKTISGFTRRHIDRPFQAPIRADIRERNTSLRVTTMSNFRRKRVARFRMPSRLCARCLPGHSSDG